LQEFPELKFEPQSALYGGGKDGLDTYRRFFAQVQKNLKPNGLIIIEAELNQHQEIIKIGAKNDLKHTDTKNLSLLFQQGQIIELEGDKL